jgi:diguanylate cyclase (GGDEF)-like protein
VQQEISEKSVMDRLADESGVAIALVDESSREIYVANNNSICRNLNPEGKFLGQCAAFCGTAFQETAEVGAPVSFTCHAGLECRVVPIKDSARPLVAIVGRAFVKADNYRKATERAISGDWSKYPPAEFFENILLTGSVSVLEKTAEKIAGLLPTVDHAPAKPKVETPAEGKVETHIQNERMLDEPSHKKTPEISTIVERFNREVGLEPKVTKAKIVSPVNEEFSKPQIVPRVKEEIPVAVNEPDPESEPTPQSNEKRVAEARAWRSFFGSLLKTDYPKAAVSILEFLSIQYGFSALIWLEKKENRLENAATFGEMKGRRVRLGIASDDARLLEAAQNEVPLEFSEHSKRESARAPRTMSLFPIGLAGDISAGIAILDPINDETVKKQIARICHSIAPQLEILRLRSEVARGETLSTAIRRFSESLKRVDSDDLWLNLTQNAAEMMRAERASLLIYDEKGETLEIKALVGAKTTPAKGEEAGTRVAKIVFGKKQPLIVADVAKTGLPPPGPDRQYKTSSFLSCPISIGGRTIGVMNFTDKASGLAFDRTSLDLFRAIAPQLAVAIDRASLKEKAGEFEQLSVTDALTGLLNRRYIEERLMEEVKRSNRHGFPMSFMMIDVDHFKSFNDQFGHPAGDEALKIVGHVIRETLRGADVAARFGGEEFAILLPQTTAEEAAAIGERIRGNIEETDFRHRKVTISIGIASCSAELCSAPVLVSAADKALYEAKRGGRNRAVAFEEMPDPPAK